MGCWRARSCPLRRGGEGDSRATSTSTSLVAKGFEIRIEGVRYEPCVRYLTRVLAEPPFDERDVELRREVLRELAAREVERHSLERIYVVLVRLRTLLCAPRQPSPRGRRIEILRTVREAFELLASSFAGASSALARLRVFGESVVAGAGFKRLAALLDHDELQAALDLRVRIGADGEVRAMEIVGIHENKGNPFHASALKRFFVRLIFFFRGYRTTSGEVAERVLSDVLSGVEDEVAVCFQLLGDLEVYLGALGFRDRAANAGLSATLPERRPQGESLALEGLYNPLLLAAGVTPAPCDIRAGAGAIVLVTGPNSGGKTRLLQAVAIAQSFPIAASSSPRAARASLARRASSRRSSKRRAPINRRVTSGWSSSGSGGASTSSTPARWSSWTSSVREPIHPKAKRSRASFFRSSPSSGCAFVTTHLLNFAERLGRQSNASLGSSRWNSTRKSGPPTGSLRASRERRSRTRPPSASA